MLSSDEVRQLDRLTFGGATASPLTAISGAHVARFRGFSTEFHDFRQYQPGDDPRAVEWTVYSRLGQLVTRTYRVSAQFRVHLLVDVSASMSVGAPDKLSCATKLAALLAYAALRGRDAVALATFNERIAERIVPSSGRPQLLRVFATLDQAIARGRSAIGTSLTNYASVESGPGLAVVISDFFDPSGPTEGLRYLLYRGLTPAVVQILSPEDLDPRFVAGAELVDAEAPETATLFADGASLSAYRSALDENRAVLRAFCDQYALPFLQLTSGESFANMLRECSRAGLFLQHG